MSGGDGMFTGVNMVVTWLIIFAILLAVELATAGLTTVWFAAGALIAALAALLHAPLWLQVILFLLASIALLFFTRPIAVKYFNKNRARTNVESYIGQKAIVIADIENIKGYGQVRLGSMDWSAKSFDGSDIKAGTVVEVKEVEGVKLVVSPVAE